MNRLVGPLPRGGTDAVAFSPAMPVVLRGPVEVMTYAPSALPHTNQELMQRVEQLYAMDSPLHGRWSAALDALSMAREMSGGEGR